MNIGPVLAGAASAVQSAITPGATGTGRAARAVISRGTAAPTAARPTSLATLAKGVAASAGQRNAEQLGGLLTRFARGAVSGTALATPETSASLAFLKDPRLSVEEKLARLMVQLSDKYERQLEEKLQQFAQLDEGKASSATAKKTGGTSLASLGSGLASLVSKAGGGGSGLGGALLPKLAGQLAGPVLAGAATALGMPALAPALLKAGPAIGGIASSLAGGSTKSATAKSSPSSSGAAPSEKQLMTEIQILQEKQREMFTLVSNILRSQHDTKMAVVGNIR